MSKHLIFELKQRGITLNAFQIKQAKQVTEQGKVPIVQSCFLCSALFLFHPLILRVKFDGYY